MPTPLQGGKRKELMVLCCSRYEHDTKVTVSAAHTSHSSSLCQFLRQFCKRCPYYFHATLWLKKRRNIQLCKTYEAPRALWSSTGIQRDLEIPTAGARSVNVCRASCTCEPLLSSCLTPLQPHWHPCWSSNTPDTCRLKTGAFAGLCLGGVPLQVSILSFLPSSI